MPIVTVVIVNHNGKRFLKDCIESIRAQTLKDIEIVLSDTDSIDGSYQFVRASYPYVKFLKGPNNGYGYACNRGAEVATSRNLAFFNEDMKLPPDFLEKVLQYHLRIPQEVRGVTATYILNKGTSPEEAVTHPGKIDLCGFPVDSDTDDSVVMPGCPFFIDSDLFKKTGGFNENIFLYGEDVDYSWRLKIFGYKSHLYKGTYIHHYGSASGVNTTAKGLMRILTSGFVPAFCNFGPILFTLSLILNFILITVSSIIFFISKGFKLEILSHYTSFIVSVFHNLPKLIKMRKFVQKNRRLSDRQIVKTYVLVSAFVYNRIMRLIDRHRVV